MAKVRRQAADRFPIPGGLDPGGYPFSVAPRSTATDIPKTERRGRHRPGRTRLNPISCSDHCRTPGWVCPDDLERPEVHTLHDRRLSTGCWPSFSCKKFPSFTNSYCHSPGVLVGDAIGCHPRRFRHAIACLRGWPRARVPGERRIAQHQELCLGLVLAVRHPSGREDLSGRLLGQNSYGYTAEPRTAKGIDRRRRSHRPHPGLRPGKAGRCITDCRFWARTIRGIAGEGPTAAHPGSVRGFRHTRGRPGSWRELSPVLCPCRTFFVASRSPRPNRRAKSGCSLPESLDAASVANVRTASRALGVLRISPRVWRGSSKLRAGCGKRHLHGARPDRRRTGP
jgi:hypothetical protein